MPATENIIPIDSDVQRYLNDGQVILDNDVATAFKELRIATLLNAGRIKKRTGHCVNRIVFELFLIPFVMFSNVYLFVHAQYEKAVSHKNRFYRFLENANYNWRQFQLNLSYRVHQTIMQPLPAQQFFVLDETIVAVKGKLIEMASYVYDPTVGKSVLGFEKLVLGLFDGNHFIPLGQRICSSKRKPKARSKATKYKKVPKSERIAPNSPGAIERAEARQSKLDKAFSLLKQSKNKGFDASTLLMDSWFCFNCFLIKVVTQLNLNVICQLKNLPRTNKYLYKGHGYSLKTLFTGVAEPKLRMVKKYHFRQAIATVSLPNSDVKLKIVFVQNPQQDKWYAFAATNVNLGAQAILCAYSKRWSIEVYFKNAKQYLNLGKEQMSNLDSIIASDALVMLRYAVLTYIAAKHKAQFYATFDALRDQNTKQCFGIKLLQFFLNQLRFVIKKVAQLVELDLKEQAIKLLQQIENLAITSQQLQPQMK
jgi:hypothetical protein